MTTESDTASSTVKRRIVVYHTRYGCDTGCCGHTVEVDGVSYDSRFVFAHPCGDDFRAFAEELIREEYGEDHVKDLDWDNCDVAGD